MGIWQRFWVGRTATLDLSDDGFLRDPEDEFVRALPGAPVNLAALQKFRALALLGEPGMGKSVSLADEAERVSRNGDGAVSIRADLRSYSSDSLLYRARAVRPRKRRICLSCASLWVRLTST
jgi:hypothetical protein